MKKIINNKMYDADNSITIVEKIHYSNGNSLGKSAVMKTKNGAYFYMTEKNQNQYSYLDETIEELSMQDALTKASQLCEYDRELEVVNKEFSELIEEA